MDRGRQFFFSQPVVRDRGGDLGKTWYVSLEWAWEGEEVHRERVYSGRKWGVVGRGNRADTLKERREYFARVAEVLVGMLRRGDNPFEPLDTTSLPLRLADAFALALAERARYVEVETREVLQRMVRRALAHWPANILVKACNDCTSARVVEQLAGWEYYIQSEFPGYAPIVGNNDRPWIDR